MNPIYFPKTCSWFYCDSFICYKEKHITDSILVWNSDFSPSNEFSVN